MPLGTLSQALPRLVCTAHYATMDSPYGTGFSDQPLLQVALAATRASIAATGPDGGKPENFRRLIGHDPATRPLQASWIETWDSGRKKSNPSGPCQTVQERTAAVRNRPGITCPVWREYDPVLPGPSARNGRNYRRLPCRGSFWLHRNVWMQRH